MKRIGAIIALATGVALSVGVAPAAQATDFHGTNCPGAPYACLWKDTDFATVGNRNDYFEFKMYFGDARNFKFGSTGYVVDDKTTSMVNDATSRTLWMYNGFNCTGSETVKKGPETYDSDFSNDSPLAGGAFDNSLSSAAFDNYLSSC